MEDTFLNKTKKIVFYIVGIVICLFIAFFVLDFVKNKLGDKNNNIIPEMTTPDVKNMSYIVSGEIFNLKNGRAENTYSTSSASKNILNIFGEPVYGDLNGDSVMDAVILLENNTGGSGMFYYAVLVINTGTTSKPTNAMLLGDRIAPQTVEIQDGHALYNFAERRYGEPMTTRPSMGKSVWVYYDSKDNTIGEWVKDFEGESAYGITETVAKNIAEKTCIKGGEALGAGIHNKNTQTWWFDANLNSVREGCNPACVVNEITKTAEINWRCTGLIN